MKIATGHTITKNQVDHDFTQVRFLCDDGSPVFEVSIGVDGRSIEVRGVGSYSHGGYVYVEPLEISPIYSNVIEIRTRKYER